MAANVAPIFTKLPINDGVVLIGFSTSSSGAGLIGAGGDLALVVTAGADGAFISKVRFIPTATTPTATSATVLRIYVSTVASGATTTATTVLWEERAVATQNASNSAANVNPVDVALNIPLKPGQSILVAQHVAPAANSSWRALAIGGHY
jgi:predicted methyltransferase